eukprot:g471.t1
MYCSLNDNTPLSTEASRASDASSMKPFLQPSSAPFKPKAPKLDFNVPDFIPKTMAVKNTHNNSKQCLTDNTALGFVYNNTINSSTTSFPMQSRVPTNMNLLMKKRRDELLRKYRGQNYSQRINKKFGANPLPYGGATGLGLAGIHPGSSSHYQPYNYYIHENSKMTNIITANPKPIVMGDPKTNVSKIINEVNNFGGSITLPTNSAAMIKTRNTVCEQLLDHHYNNASSQKKTEQKKIQITRNDDQHKCCGKTNIKVTDTAERDGNDSVAMLPTTTSIVINPENHRNCNSKRFMKTSHSDHTLSPVEDMLRISINEIEPDVLETFAYQSDSDDSMEEDTNSKSLMRKHYETQHVETLANDPIVTTNNSIVAMNNSIVAMNNSIVNTNNSIVAMNEPIVTVNDAITQRMKIASQIGIAASNCAILASNPSFHLTKEQKDIICDDKGIAKEITIYPVKLQFTEIATVLAEGMQAPNFKIVVYFPTRRICQLHAKMFEKMGYPVVEYYEKKVISKRREGEGEEKSNKIRWHNGCGQDTDVISENFTSLQNTNCVLESFHKSLHLILFTCSSTISHHHRCCSQQNNNNEDQRKKSENGKKKQQSTTNEPKKKPLDNNVSLPSSSVSLSEPSFYFKDITMILQVGLPSEPSEFFYRILQCHGLPTKNNRGLQTKNNRSIVPKNDLGDLITRLDETKGDNNSIKRHDFLQRTRQRDGSFGKSATVMEKGNTEPYCFGRPLRCVLLLADFEASCQPLFTTVPYYVAEKEEERLTTMKPTTTITEKNLVEQHSMTKYISKRRSKHPPGLSRPPGLPAPIVVDIMDHDIKKDHTAHCTDVTLQSVNDGTTLLSRRLKTVPLTLIKRNAVSLTRQGLRETVHQAYRRVSPYRRLKAFYSWIKHYAIHQKNATNYLQWDLSTLFYYTKLFAIETLCYANIQSVPPIPRKLFLCITANEVPDSSSRTGVNTGITEKKHIGIGTQSHGGMEHRVGMKNSIGIEERIGTQMRVDIEKRIGMKNRIGIEKSTGNSCIGQHVSTWGLTFTGQKRKEEDKFTVVPTLRQYKAKLQLKLQSTYAY